jgi:fructuronate reductase
MKLNRENHPVAKAPERLVHMGIGAFFRAHQAWYTAKSDAENAWGYVAFTGRSAQVADELRDQDGLYTLVTRGAEGDSFEVIPSVVRVEDGGELGIFTDAVANPEIAAVTITITESGYALDADGELLNAQSQLDGLRSGKPVTALGRLAWALNERRQRNGVPIALVPCDNIPKNGTLLKSAMVELISVFGDSAVDWLNSKVSFVSTSIDRITPKTTSDDLRIVSDKAGWEDASPVVTEPFRDWVIEGEFPNGRPNWESAGARFVSEIEPFENRKLWLLNGSHSLLAYAGLNRGHKTVEEAITDELCLAAVEAFWDEVERTLDNPELGITAYRAALLERFRNPRIAHQLSQIAIDGSTKIRVRVVPTAKAELEAGRPATGAAFAIASWINFALTGEILFDSRRSELEKIHSDTNGDNSMAAIALLKLLDPQLAANRNFVALIIKLLKTTAK